MEITDRQIKNLFTITNMIPVDIPKGIAGQNVSLKINGIDTNATYLMDLESGQAIALLTDKGNWYLVGEKQKTEFQSNTRVISYRKTEMNKLVATTYTYAFLLTEIGVVSSTSVLSNGNRTRIDTFILTNYPRTITVYITFQFQNINSTTVNVNGTIYTCSQNIETVSFVISTSTIIIRYDNLRTGSGDQTASEFLEYVIPIYLTDGKNLTQLGEFQKTKFGSSPLISPYLTANQSNFVATIKYKQNFNSSTWDSIRIIQLDKSLNITSNILYTTTIPDGIADWRKSYTQSFLNSPTADIDSCINTYRSSNTFNLNTKSNQIIQYLGIVSGKPGLLLQNTQATIKVSKYNSGSTCSLSSSSNQKVKIPTTTAIAALLPYVNITGDIFI